ncbi:hypothetical protein GCM10010981_18090 [Dyella nitratireducens]|uniref:DUF2489 domain-containing protein n=1 Tax=Dyella nitratireducens TaxID=1849580 RepID=A0ABQ1FSN8_9GAMM|nr:hypothetical protein GCM10010981_18090 [Dyella nitratireducens]GLQ43126.1 hypothetical protein GCM10007902_29760 [Dyella nitratireducens]
MDRPPLNEEEREARQQLAYLLRLVLSGYCSYLEAAPQVVYLRSRVGGVADFDDDFRAFVGINSETDHLPTWATRHLWAEHAIKALEPEIARLEARAADLARGSCEALLIRFAETNA